MKHIKIIGAGPSGLCAAINLVKAGYNVDVFEKRNDSGRRFKGDLEGFENWSSKNDVIEEIKSFNIKLNFGCFPFKSFHITDGNTVLNSSFKKPIFYLVKRGPIEQSLDQGLKNQALNQGVKINFNSTINREKADIIATGVEGIKPTGIAKGITFDTESENIAVAILNKKTSNRGYSYLLINNGHGTICTVNFQTPNLNINLYLKNTLELIKKIFDVEIRNRKNAGGIGCFQIHPRLVIDNKLIVGEAAGLQDLLWGFGMRYALTSGFLASKSIIENVDYRELITNELSGKINSSIFNRFLVDIIGNRINKYLIWRAKRNNNWLNLLYLGYNPSIMSKFSLPIARWFLQQKYHTLWDK